MTCPSCKLDANHPIIWNRRALCLLLLELLLIPVQIFLMLLLEVPLAFDVYRRKCSRCGQIFSGPRKEPRNFDVCPKCGYNLTGNVSGRCSECGWRLRRRYRVHRRQKDGKP